MKQRLHITLPVLVLALAFVLHSCKPESPCNPNEKPVSETYWLSADAKSKIPFRKDGLDTLVYISDAGDTTTLYGQGVDSFYRSESKNRNPDPDCPVWDSWKYENLVYRYRGNAIPLMECEFYTRQYGLSALQVNINNTLNEGLVSLLSANNPNLYTDTVTINGNVYSGIRLYRSYTPGDTTKNILYHYQHGILQVKIGNTTWHKKL